MDWDDLRYVLAVARQKTLSQAAGHLGVTHTTVGRRVRAIEMRLGVRLFDRTPDGFIATAAGQDIREVAESMEGDVLALEGRVLGQDAHLSGSLRVSTLDLLFDAHHDLLASFVDRYPSVELTVLTTANEVSLTRREADVALRMSNTPPEYLVGRRVGRVAFAVYASNALVERTGADARLVDYPWLHWDNPATARWLDGWLDDNAPGARVAMRMGDDHAILRGALRSGVGVHFYTCYDGASDPALTRISPTYPEFSRDVWLLTLPGLRNTRRIQAFMSHVAEGFLPRRAAMAGSVAPPDAPASQLTLPPSSSPDGSR